MPRPAPRRNRRVVAQWPGWWFGPDGDKALFDTPEDVPQGWKNRPWQQFEIVETEATLPKEEAIQQLKALGVSIDPRWGTAKLNEVLKEQTNDG